MSSATTRRAFLGASVGLAGWALADEPGRFPYAQGGPPAERAGARPKIAAVTTVYHYLSHAYHIVGRFLDGFVVHDGRGFHRPPFEIASLFIEQTPANDLGRTKANRHGVRLAPSIADALTLGTGQLAVDGVLLIAEHGDYPYNEKLQKLYPRGRFFREVLEVFRGSGRGVPVFLDKHLSYDRAEARRMVEEAKALGVPLMAGSSLPVTWRLPPVEVPLGKTWREAVVASRGEIEIFGFHALETLQCMIERRDRKGRPQGVVAVTCLEGDDVWKAGDAGRWSWELLDRALSRSHTLNPGDVRQNTRDFVPPPGRPTFLATPIAFLVEYADGLRAAALILNGHVDDTTFAGRLEGGSVVSTLFYLPAPPGAKFFDPLVLRIEDFFRSRKPPYPVERTLLTGGILDAALESRLQKGRRVETPDLAAIDYEAPADSGFIRSPIAEDG
ncbi:MAG: hypothetical protein IRY99_02990 [Isosphaeraceae bacterium]|nr:hypothetical protein [Isosphaeraceae bacterium]